jgi:hypothetical protein
MIQVQPNKPASKVYDKLITKFATHKTAVLKQLTGSA